MQRIVEATPFTVAQARAAGMFEWQIAHGPWRIPHSGVRAVGPAPSDIAARCRELLPVLPDGVAFCRSTALDLFGVDHPRGLSHPTAIHVQVPRTRARPRRTGVIAHTRVNPHPATRTRHGCPVISPERTWIDLADELTVTELVVLGDALLRRSRPVSRIDFLTLAQGEVPAGTRGLRRLRAALPLIRARTDSCQETRLRLLLRDAGLPEPEVNRPILDRQRILAIPDLSYPDARLAIEYDGDIHRTDRRTWTRDLARRRTLEAHNWLIHTWTAADLRDPTRALGHLRRQLSRR